MNLNCWVSKIDESLRSVLSIRISLLGQSIPPMIPSNSISIQFCNRQIKKHLEFETAAQNLINTKFSFHITRLSTRRFPIAVKRCGAI